MKRATRAARLRWRGPRLPARSLNLSLAEAASRHIDVAIDVVSRGDFDVALTLADAADGMSKRDGLHMFAWLRDNFDAKERFANQQEWIALLNRERDWLKHASEASMEIECASAALMIARVSRGNQGDSAHCVA